MDNIKSALETWLRSVKGIPDNRDVKITFNFGTTLTVKEWEALETVPVTITQEQEGVESHRING